MDEDGFFYFRGRRNRMIKSSGFNVYPAQVEGVLYEHPLVAEACLVGVAKVDYRALAREHEGSRLQVNTPA
jgi:acyl-CoA synthetase (AMP-forming)/AMP-acid ligase II